MPIHDWSRVDAGLFHDFHQSWIIEIRNALNGGVLPPEFYALAEQSVRGPIPDVVTLTQHRGAESRTAETGGIALADAPPRATYIATAEVDPYAERANRIAIRHRDGEVVAVIEIVPPGNKSSAGALRTFVQKAEELLRKGIHLLIVDLLPPSQRDPQGIHKAIWDQIEEQPFELPSGKPLTVVAYQAREAKTAYVEPLAVGDRLPALPIFLDAYTYVPAPLEESYSLTWEKCPGVLKKAVESAL